MNKQIVLNHEVYAFLNLEADLLDQGKFEDWLELYEEDGIYWIPSSPHQEDMFGEVSIILEDKQLLQLRVMRLAHPRAHAVNPHPSTIHLVGNVSVGKDGELVTAKSKLIMTEFRNDQETQLSGNVTHVLRKRKGRFGIQLKRVDLIKAGGTFSAITVPL